MLSLIRPDPLDHNEMPPKRDQTLCDPLHNQDQSVRHHLWSILKLVRFAVRGIISSTRTSVRMSWNKQLKDQINKHHHQSSRTTSMKTSPQLFCVRHKLTDWIDVCYMINEIPFSKIHCDFSIRRWFLKNSGEQKHDEKFPSFHPNWLTSLPVA